MTGRRGATVLLDTCAVIWFAAGEQMASLAVSSIRDAGRAGGIFVSPITAWEIGLLSQSKPGRPAALQFLPDAKTWFSRFMSVPAIYIASLTPEIAIDATSLPGEFHRDPADRLIVATARHLGAPIVTRDRRIVAYAEAGFVRAIAC